MVSSHATTVEQYLVEISDDRRGDVEAVRELVLANLPDGYVETMRWGMITYEVPLETYPDTYNGKPLMFVALAAQKRHLALYLTNVAFVRGGEEAFKDSQERDARKARLCEQYSVVLFVVAKEDDVDGLVQRIREHYRNLRKRTRAPG